MGIGVRDRVVQKLIAVLQGASHVSKFCGNRVYGAHISTIQDPVLPCVTIQQLTSPGRESAGGYFDDLFFQIEAWMPAVGRDARVWDDVFLCTAGIVHALQKQTLTDTSIGIKFLEVSQEGKGPNLKDQDGIMHIPTRWRIRATT